MKAVGAIMILDMVSATGSPPVSASINWLSAMERRITPRMFGAFG